MDTVFRPMSNYEVDAAMRRYREEESERIAEEKRLAVEAEGLARPPDEVQVPLYVPTIEEAIKMVAKIRSGRAQAAQWQSRVELRPETPALIQETSEWNDSDPVDSPSASPAIAEVVMPPAPAPAPAPAPTPVPDPLLPALPAAALGFPVSTVESMPLADDPLRDLAALCHRIVSPDDYLDARSEYCRLSVQLNTKGVLAPAFRPRVTIKTNLGHPVYMLAHRDQLVIDYFWCYATNMNLNPTCAFHSKLFAPGYAFSFVAAWELSGRKWKGGYRGSEALALTTLQQCQTLTLCGFDLVEQKKKLVGGYRASKGRSPSDYPIALREIKEWAESNCRMKAEQRVYECLWLARRLLATPSVEMIRKLLALMLGEPVRDRKTIRGKLALLDKYVTP